MDPAPPAGLPCWRLWPDELLTAGFRQPVSPATIRGGWSLAQVHAARKRRTFSPGELDWAPEILVSFIHSLIHKLLSAWWWREA